VIDALKLRLSAIRNLAPLGELGRRHAAERKRRGIGHPAGGTGRLCLLLSQRAGHRGREDISLAQWNLGKRVGGYAEVLRQDVGRRMRDPIGQQQRVVFGLLAIIERQQKLTSVVTNALQ
jgi:hypothetical protein